jgi:hypothetical protein
MLSKIELNNLIGEIKLNNPELDNTNLDMMIRLAVVNLNHEKSNIDRGKFIEWILNFTPIDFIEVVGIGIIRETILVKNGMDPLVDYLGKILILMAGKVCQVVDNQEETKIKATQLVVLEEFIKIVKREYLKGRLRTPEEIFNFMEQTLKSRAGLYFESTIITIGAKEARIEEEMWRIRREKIRKEEKYRISGEKLDDVAIQQRGERIEIKVGY